MFFFHWIKCVTFVCILIYTIVIAGILFAQILFLLGHCSTIWRVICTNNFSDNSGILFAIVFSFDWCIMITPFVSSISLTFSLNWLCRDIFCVFQRISSMYYGLLDKLLKAIGMGFLIVPGRIATIINNTVLTWNMALYYLYTSFQAVDVTNKYIENKGEITVYDRIVNFNKLIKTKNNRMNRNVQIHSLKHGAKW